jgi:SdrD B-like domain
LACQHRGTAGYSACPPASVRRRGDAVGIDVLLEYHTVSPRTHTPRSLARTHRPLIDRLEQRRLLAVLDFTIDATASTLTASGSTVSEEFFSEILDDSYNNPAVVQGTLRAEVGTRAVAFRSGGLIDVVAGGVNNVDPNLPASDYAFFTEQGDPLTMLYKNINLNLVGTSVREGSVLRTSRLESKFTAGTIDYKLGTTDLSVSMVNEGSDLENAAGSVTYGGGLITLQIPYETVYSFTLDGTSADVGPITNYLQLSGTIVARAVIGPISFISGTVVNDQSDDGIWQDGEVGLGRRVVYVDLNNNRRIDDIEPIADTDSRGRYRINEIPVGTYSVRLLNQEGWRNTSPLSGTHTVSITPGNNAPNRQFLVTKRGLIGGNVFFDRNRNGTKQKNETRDVSAFVYLDANNNAIFDEGERNTTTTPNGEYSFNRLAPGEYFVRLSEQPGVRITTANRGVARVSVSEGSSIRVDRFGIFFPEGFLVGIESTGLRANALADSVTRSTKRITLDDLSIV